MTPDDASLMEWAFKGGVTGLFLIGGWLWKTLVTVVQTTKDDLNAHKLHVSENYARKTDLTPIYSILNEVRGDVKTLIGRKQERESLNE